VKLPCGEERRSRRTIAVGRSFVCSCPHKTPSALVSTRFRRTQGTAKGKKGEGVAGI